MPWQKRVADFFTLTRAPLALAVIGLGLQRGRDGIEVAWLLLVVAATVDTLDGHFARMAPGDYKTWVGSHDLLFDVLFSTALLIYLVLAGYIGPWLAAVYLVFWLVMTTLTDGAANVRAVIFQGPIYLKTVFAAIEANSSVFWWTVAWLLIMGLFAGRRFLYVRVPALLRDFSTSVHNFPQRRRKS